MDLHAIGTQPIDPDRPAGSDVRYEPAFEELQAEVDKLSLPSAAGTGIDWQKVSDLAAAILAGQAKDLLVASYLGVARIHLEQYRGLQEALGLLADLLQHFWDTLFPPRKRMRGRLAAIEWWIEKSETALEMLPAATLSEEEKTALYGACERLEQLLADLFPEPPSLGPVTRLLDELAVHAAPAEPAGRPVPPEEPAAAAPAEAAPAEATASPASVPPAAATTGSAPAEPPVDVTGAEKVIRDCLQAICRALPLVRADNPAGPRAYRLLRVALWTPVDALPPATDGRTLIPPPEPQAAARLGELLRRGDWAGLLEAAETQLSQSMLWLDLNRFSSTALDRLGPPFRAAAEAVRGETAMLVQRLAGLEALSFADGTPLADQETRDWLQTIAPAGMPAGLGLAEGDQAPGPDEARFTEVFDRARALVEENRLIKAVALLQEEMQHSFSASDRLRWRLALVRILVTSGNTALALPHFDQLLSDIDAFRLESWDPGLALTCFKVIRSGLKSLSDKETRERADTILNRIARLDPVEALRQGGR